MIKLIKKGGLRERANRSRTYQGSENTESTLKPNTYRDIKTSMVDSHQEDNKSTQSAQVHTK